MRKILLLLAVACSPVDIPGKDRVYDYDMAYLINLDRNPERFKAMDQQFLRENIRGKRFSAVDGYRITLIDKTTGEIISGKESMLGVGKYTWKKRPARYRVTQDDRHRDAEFDLLVKFRQFSAGEIGCIYSHRAVWRDIVKNNYRNAIVFEDDLVLSKDFKKNLIKLIRNIPRDADITFIGIGRMKGKAVLYPSIDDIFRDFDHVKGNDFVAKIQPTNLLFGTYAYIIGAESAKKLLKLTDDCSYPLDDIILQQGGIDRGVIRGYVAKKKTFSIAPTDSEIKKMGRSF
ncbi:MAG: glycosyltransferase family 25 protein [Holosporaceae bacterium]|jgi:glycosyl transferase family 25|nr:glycosyltransferase family 25 protein [Holosporaceae bacterium]